MKSRRSGQDPPTPVGLRGLEGQVGPPGQRSPESPVQQGEQGYNLIFSVSGKSGFKTSTPYLIFDILQFRISSLIFWIFFPI